MEDQSLTSSAKGGTSLFASENRARPPPPTSRVDDWLGRAIDAATIVSTAAQLTPIAWIGPAASLVVKFLEMVQVRRALSVLVTLLVDADARMTR